ncbi:TraR/DksA family transcriptional regulator [Stutzerimonas frequens]|uniref:TraR/DksA family transcriptional regulator n=1 Tax=Stutzerimonas frequens TaxID=2968969 RepID=UPI0007B86E80|nr:TraR/DksA family transcriptional regulator [Stutzerimonas frequens]KZX56689.1 TraR/DksA family transcriptional regulator [Stutzerimonas frequens]
MTDYMEMAAAFEQARTAPDVTDRASGLEEADRIGGVALVQARLQGQGAEFCLACDGAIPAKRRAAATWAQRCISCLDDHDKREARRHG